MNQDTDTIDIDNLCVNTLRFLAVDAVEKAKSGHPGLPLGAAAMAYTLFDRILRFNPSNPGWHDRDRFILSAGHGCALLYALLHLTGYDLPLEQLQRFRQLGSVTPGHPEYGLAPGIEVTTGPLGQGFAMGVGMAIAERHLAAYFNRDGFPVVNHHIFSIVSDGDLMEGVASEAASLAGHLGLSKLIYLYDDNDVSIDGRTDITFTEDVAKRFEAYNWRIEHLPDGNDLEDIEKALRAAKSQNDKPTLIIATTHIGFGSPKQDTPAAHGEPLGQEALVKTKQKLGWPMEPSFYIPEKALSHFREAVPRGQKLEFDWQNLFGEYRMAYSELAAEFESTVTGLLPKGWDSEVPRFGGDVGAMATRDASGKVMNALSKKLRFFMGGSADLAASTKTDLKDAGDFKKDNPLGRNLRFGVREHAMGSISNGMRQHGGIIPYTGTFLVFSDYMRPAIRLAALMGTHVIFTFSHDSIGLGEDGPTHQPIGHLMSLRAIPDLVVLRPADPNETAAAWMVALQQQGPVALITTRQKLPVLGPEYYPVFDGVPKGAYTLVASRKTRPDVILIASGSEVQLILGAREDLASQGVDARVVSMPSWELFDSQPEEYREQVLPSGAPKLAVEAAITLGWHKYVGDNGDVIGIDRFGASAPGDVVLTYFGFTVDNVVQRALKLIRR